MMTPLMVEMLLAAHYSPPDVWQEQVRFHSPAAMEARADWIAANVMHEDGTLTEMGDALVDMILSTPLPVMRWMDPRTLPKTA